MTPDIRSQESTHSVCHVWGDPHLVMFGGDLALENSRMGYRCFTPGRLTVLKNNFIEFYVDVTEQPFWNEKVSGCSMLESLLDSSDSSSKLNFSPIAK